MFFRKNKERSSATTNATIEVEEFKQITTYINPAATAIDNKVSLPFFLNSMSMNNAKNGKYSKMCKL